MSYMNRHISNDTWIAYDGMSNPEEKEIEVTVNFITEDGFEKGYYEISYFSPRNCRTQTFYCERKDYLYGRIYDMIQSTEKCDTVYKYEES